MILRWRLWRIKRKWARYWSGERDPLVLFWKELGEMSRKDQK